MNTILERWAAPTPKFFKILRNVGIVIGAVGTAILSAPVVLPAVVTQISGYLVLAGAVASAVSQLTTLSDTSHQAIPQDESKSSSKV